MKDDSIKSEEEEEGKRMRKREKEKSRGETQHSWSVESSPFSWSREIAG